MALVVASACVIGVAILQRARVRTFVLPRVSDQAWRLPGLRTAMSRSWERKYRQLQDRKLPRGAVVMLGDSITEFADWVSLIPDVEVHNHGIGGDDTIGVLRRLHLVTQAAPSAVFLMIGTNDLGKRDLSVEEIVTNVAAILDRIRSESPTTDVYVQSVLPRWHTRCAEVAQLNAGIEGLVRERNVTWIDLRPLFDRGDGSMDLALAPDALHPNVDGYRRWATAIEPYFKQPMAESE
jgi:lysophospholipase L1-like esterase